MTPQQVIEKFRTIRRKEALLCLGTNPSICIMGYIEWHEMQESVRVIMIGTKLADRLDGRETFMFENCTIYPSLTMERGMFFGNNFIP